jgi:ubiquitin-conjugating enzyme E2 Z
MNGDTPLTPTQTKKIEALAALPQSQQISQAKQIQTQQTETLALPQAHGDTPLTPTQTKWQSNSNGVSSQTNIVLFDQAPQQQTPLSRDTVKRLIKDVREITKTPLTSHGIYYHHSKDDILIGQAMIIGPSDTPYEQGYYFFEFKFPEDYPHKPPVVKYYTNDGITRFNPNLYKSGKVCVSVLNTWKGDQWTGCQSISSILLVLCTLLNKTPLLNEPGITERHSDFHSYHKIVTCMNYKVAIVQMAKSEMIKKKFPELYDIMIDNFLSNYGKIMELFDKNYRKNPERKFITTSVYNMMVVVDYSAVRNELVDLYTILKSR